jgi:hypothetical protein
MDAIFQVLGQRVLREIKLNNGTEPTSLIVSEDEMKRIADYAHNRFGNFEYVRIAMYELHKTLTLRLTVVEVGMEKASGDGRFGYGFRAAPKRGRHAGQSDTASDFTPPKVGFDFGQVSRDEARERWTKPSYSTAEERKKVDEEFNRAFSKGYHHPTPEEHQEFLRKEWGTPPEPPKRPSPFEVSGEDIKRAEDQAPTEENKNAWRAEKWTSTWKEYAEKNGWKSNPKHDDAVEDIASDPFMSEDLRKMVEEAMRRAAGLK